MESKPDIRLTQFLNVTITYKQYFVSELKLKNLLNSHCLNLITNNFIKNL